MKHRRRQRLILGMAIVVVALVVLAALPCGAFLHGPHDTCALCFLQVAEAPPDIVPPSFVQETGIVQATEAQAEPQRVWRSPRTTRGPPPRA